MAKTLTIDERFALLDEATEFYSDLSDAGKEIFDLSRKKAAALSTVKEWLGVYKERMMNGADWTEKDLEDWLNSVIRPEFVDMMAVEYDMKEEEKDFYEGWFGMAIGILTGEEDTLNQLKREQARYDELVQAKMENRPLSDLLK